jgi:hypothetical protein
MFLQRTQKLVKLESAQKALQKAKPQNQKEVSDFLLTLIHPSGQYVTIAPRLRDIFPGSVYHNFSYIIFGFPIVGGSEKYGRKRISRHFGKM